MSMVRYAPPVVRAIVVLSLWVGVPGFARAQLAIDGRPPTLVPEVLGATTEIELYEERTRFLLGADTRIDAPAVADGYPPFPETEPGVAGGTRVSCFLVHFSGTPPRRATVTLGPDVRLLGLVGTEPLLDVWDPICAPEYPVDYPTGSGARGGLGGGDMARVRTDLRTIEIDFVEGTSAVDLDQMRILVAPATGAMPEADGGVIASGSWDYRGSGGLTCSVRPHAGAEPAGMWGVMVVLLVGARRRFCSR